METNIKTTLIEIKLNDNLISSIGAIAIAIAKALETNSKLSTLDIGYNSIGSIGATAIANALKTNTTLSTLVLSKNRIGDDGTEAIAEALEINKILTEIKLDGNLIYDEIKTKILDKEKRIIFN